MLEIIKRREANRLVCVARWEIPRLSNPEVVIEHVFPLDSQYLLAPHEESLQDFEPVCLL